MIFAKICSSYNPYVRQSPTIEDLCGIYPAMVKNELVSDQWLSLSFVKLGNRFSLADFMSFFFFFKSSQM